MYSTGTNTVHDSKKIVSPIYHVCLKGKTEIAGAAEVMYRKFILLDWRESSDKLKMMRCVNPFQHELPLSFKVIKCTLATKHID